MAFNTGGNTEAFSSRYILHMHADRRPQSPQTRPHHDSFSWLLISDFRKAPTNTHRLSLQIKCAPKARSRRDVILARRTTERASAHAELQGWAVQGSRLRLERSRIYSYIIQAKFIKRCWKGSTLGLNQIAWAWSLETQDFHSNP